MRQIVHWLECSWPYLDGISGPSTSPASNPSPDMMSPLYNPGVVGWKRLGCRGRFFVTFRKSLQQEKKQLLLESNQSAIRKALSFSDGLVLPNLRKSTFSYKAETGVVRTYLLNKLF